MILFIGQGSEGQYIFQEQNTPFPECYGWQKLFLCCSYTARKKGTEKREAVEIPKRRTLLESYHKTARKFIT